MKKIPLRIALLSVFFLTSCKPNFLKIIPSSFVKEYCSCFFVEKKGNEACEAYATQMIKVDSFQVNQETKTVKASAFGFESTSRFRSARLGCSLP